MGGRGCTKDFRQIQMMTPRNVDGSSNKKTDNGQGGTREYKQHYIIPKLS